MSTFEMRQGVVAVSDPTMAAVLLSQTVYMGNDERSRIEGPTPDNQYKPGTFNGIEWYRNKHNGAVRVLFLIGGDPVILKHRQRLFHHGCLYVHGKDFVDHRARLMAVIADVREQAKKGNVTDSRSISVSERTMQTGRELLEPIEGKSDDGKKHKTVG